MGADANRATGTVWIVVGLEMRMDSSLDRKRARSCQVVELEIV